MGQDNQLKTQENFSCQEGKGVPRLRLWLASLELNGISRVGDVTVQSPIYAFPSWRRMSSYRACDWPRSSTVAACGFERYPSSLWTLLIQSLRYLMMPDYKNYSFRIPRGFVSPLKECSATTVSLRCITARCTDLLYRCAGKVTTQTAKEDRRRPRSACINSTSCFSLPSCCVY